MRKVVQRSNLHYEFPVPSTPLPRRNQLNYLHRGVGRASYSDRATPHRTIMLQSRQLSLLALAFDFQYSFVMPDVPIDFA